MLESKYKIVFIDIDGTLVDDEKRISEDTVSVLKRLKSNGVYVVLTSGKPYGSIEEFSKQCYATPYLIASNGAIVRDFENNTNIFSKEIDKDIATQILKHIKGANLYTMVTISGNLVVDERKFGMEPHNRKEIIVTKSLTEYFKETNEPIIKFTIIDNDKEKMEKIRKVLLTIPNINVLPIDIIGIPNSFKKEGEGYPNPYVIDVMTSGITKAEAIKSLLDYLKLDASSTIGIGDGLNDIEMFETVNYKIAMANAVKELKDMADMITASNNESGVAKALNKIFFE